MAVHYVDVQGVGDIGDLGHGIAEVGEVGGEDRRRDRESGHAFNLRAGAP